MSLFGQIAGRRRALMSTILWLIYKRLLPWQILLVARQFDCNPKLAIGDSEERVLFLHGACNFLKFESLEPNLPRGSPLPEHFYNSPQAQSVLQSFSAESRYLSKRENLSMDDVHSEFRRTGKALESP